MEVTNLLNIHTRAELYKWYLENHDKADEKAWANYNSFPETYRRIRVDFIQGYRQSGREEEVQKALRKFIQYCHVGKMLPGWDDFGRLK